MYVLSRISSLSLSFLAFHGFSASQRHTVCARVLCAVGAQQDLIRRPPTFLSVDISSGEVRVLKVPPRLCTSRVHSKWMLDNFSFSFNSLRGATHNIILCDAVPTCLTMPRADRWKRLHGLLIRRILICWSSRCQCRGTKAVAAGAATTMEAHGGRTQLLINVFLRRHVS